MWHCPRCTKMYTVKEEIFVSEKFRTLKTSRVFRADGRLANISEFFRTNNAQAPSLFSNVTSRHTRLMVWNGFWQQCPSSVKWYVMWLKKGTVASNRFIPSTSCVCLLRWKRGRSLCIVWTKKLGYSQNDEKSKNKKRRSKACKPGGRKFGMEINFVHFSIIRKLRN